MRRFGPLAALVFLLLLPLYNALAPPWTTDAERALWTGFILVPTVGNFLLFRWMIESRLAAHSEP